MSPFMLFLSGMFIGVFIGISVVALMQASRKQISYWGSERRIKTSEETLDALDPVLSTLGIKEVS